MIKIDKPIPFSLSVRNREREQKQMHTIIAHILHRIVNGRTNYSLTMDEDADFVFQVHKEVKDLDPRIKIETLELRLDRRDGSYDVKLRWV